VYVLPPWPLALDLPPLPPLSPAQASVRELMVMLLLLRRRRATLTFYSALRPLPLRPRQRPRLRLWPLRLPSRLRALLAAPVPCWARRSPRAPPPRAWHLPTPLSPAQRP
jgi:hypothetical protein